MEFNQLRYIVEIVETGSISKAAESLFVSQPNLSRQVSLLEKEIGRQIFLRKNHGVVLTREGLEVYQYAKQVVGQFELTRDKLMNHITENKIKVATCGCEIIEPAFLQVCKVFNQDNYEFELEYCNVEQSIEKLAGREVDLAIIPYTETQYKKLDQFLDSKKLCMQEIFEGELKIHISDQWELSKRDVIHIGDLNGLFHIKKSILFTGMFSLGYEMKQLRMDFSNKSVITHQIKTYEEALKTLPSFGVTPEWKCGREVNPHLKRLPLFGKRVPVTIAVIKRNDEILRKEAEYFLNALLQYKE